MDNKTKEILERYGKRLENSGSMGVNFTNSEISEDFKQFKKDMMPEFSRYERICKSIGSMLELKVAEKDRERLGKEIEAAHLEVSPENVVSLSLLTFILIFLGGLLFATAIYLLTYAEEMNLGPILLIVFLTLIASAFCFYYLGNMPKRLANKWRLKAGSQFVPCILYTVVYMKHTSNLERAIRFASQHLDAPLSLDFKKVFWDVEVGKFSTIKESLDNYLFSWRKTNPEFVESFNLIESSLFEPTEARRIQILERALQVILDGVYESMLKYTHDVRAPLSNVYMLGIVLPTLSLALIPLASALLSGFIKWYHVFIGFNVLIPFFVYYLTSEIMNKRPGGYGESSLLELNPLYPNYKSRKHYWKAFFIFFPLLILGLLPFLLQIPFIQNIFGVKGDYSYYDLGISFFGDFKIFDFIPGIGPMGLIASFLSIFLSAFLFFFFAYAYLKKTKKIILARNYSKKLEGEFNNSLFQLGNRIGDGTPAELAFGRVADSVRGQATEDFFKTVNANIQGLGMPLEKAIFDNRRGAIINYPSNLIATSMHILIEGVRKGLRVAAESLMSISDYIRNINKINERLRDLLAEVISDMKSNMIFLAPLLAGIVVGLSSMITLILGRLDYLVNSMDITLSGTVYSNIANFTDLFKAEHMISPYILQFLTALYLIEIIFILTKTLVAVDAGEDKLKETYDIGKNLISGGILYLIITTLAIVILSIIGSVVLSSIVAA